MTNKESWRALLVILGSELLAVVVFMVVAKFAKLPVAFEEQSLFLGLFLPLLAGIPGLWLVKGSRAVRITVAVLYVPLSVGFITVAGGILASVLFGIDGP
jgi:hypothetical protein